MVLLMPGCSTKSPSSGPKGRHFAPLILSAHWRKYMPQKTDAKFRRLSLWPGFLLTVFAVLTPSGFGKQMLAAPGTSDQTAPFLSFSPQSLDFGRQVTGRSGPTRRVAVTNSGSEKAFVNSAELKGDNWQDFVIVDDTCSGKTIKPTEACLISIKFTPSRTGSRRATLTVSLAGSDQPSNVDLRGSGINSADVAPFDR
jgi:HYDIN/CFA65/VesB-like, Ig-like domain